jgi:hypothetical protein
MRLSIRIVNQTRGRPIILRGNTGRNGGVAESSDQYLHPDEPSARLARAESETSGVVLRGHLLSSHRLRLAVAHGIR